MKRMEDLDERRRAILSGLLRGRNRLASQHVLWTGRREVTRDMWMSASDGQDILDYLEVSAILQEN